MPTKPPHGTSREVYIDDTLQHIDVAPVLDTAAYAAGDVLFDRTVVTNACRETDKPAILESIRWLDEDDQTPAITTLVFLSADVTLGTANAAVSITDANARNILGHVALATTDFVDLINSRIATKTNIGLVVQPVSGTRNIYVAAITAGTPTHTASGVKLRLGFRSA